MKKISVFVIFSILLISAAAQDAIFDVNLQLITQSCSDGIMNQDETSTDCGGPCNACQIITPAPVSGDGGGGGNTSFETIIRKNTTEKKNATSDYISLSGNETLVSEVSIINLSVSFFEIKPKEEIKNATFRVEKMDNVEMPDKIEAYQSFKIAADNLSDDSIEFYKIYFSVPRELAELQEIENIKLLLRSDKWEELETIYVRSNIKSHFLFALTKKLGIFTIKLPTKLKKAPDPVKDIIYEEPKLLNPTNKNKLITDLSLIFILVTILIFAIVHFIRVSKKEIIN
jgi:PGF-pre-PGF domain-containing protein